MRLAVIGVGKTAAVIRSDDLAAGICFSCPYGNVKRTGIGISAVLDGVLHYRLQGQRRYAEPGMRRIEIDDQAVLVLSLLYSEIGPYMLEFIGEWDGLRACNSGEIFAQIRSEIQHDLPGFLRILFGEAIDARHGVEDEMWTHLQDHDAGPLISDFTLLPGNFPLAAEILLDLVRQYECVHGQGGKGDADIDERVNFKKHLCDKRGCNRQHGDNETEKGFMRKKIPAFYRSRKIEKHDYCHRQQHKRIKSPAEVPQIRGNMIEITDKHRADCQEKKYYPKDEYRMKKPA